MNVRQISIVSVVLNDASGLKRTGRSLANQDSDNFEWIVIDGGSTDGTLEEIERFGTLVDKCQSESDESIYDAMTKGAALSSGSHLLFLNAGEELKADAISVFLEAMENCPADAIIVSDWDEISEQGRVHRRKAEPDKLFHHMAICHQSALIPRHIFDRLGGYSLNLAYSADFDFFLRAALNAISYHVVPARLVRYYRGGASDVKSYRCRWECIQTLHANRSPDRYSGTWHYATRMAKRVAKDIITRHKNHA